MNKRRLYDEYLKDLGKKIREGKYAPFFNVNLFEFNKALNGFNFIFANPIKKTELNKIKSYLENLMPKSIRSHFKITAEMDGVIGEIDFLMNNKPTITNITKICKAWKAKYNKIIIRDENRLLGAQEELAKKCWNASDLMTEKDTIDLVYKLTGVMI